MIRALWKKQMMEVFAWVYRDRRSGKHRTPGGIVGYALLYLCVFGSIGMLFYQAAGALCAPLREAGLGWLYFALMGLISVALGVFGSVFNTYSSLYMARDNDLLLSLPIPASRILMVRLSGVYVMGLLYELVVLLPTLMVYIREAGCRFPGVLCTLSIPLLLSVVVLTLSCLLGWVVAWISSRLKRKNHAIVLLSLAFLAGYVYLYSQAYTILGAILANPAALGERVRGFLYPFYHLGLAAEGSGVSLLLFAVMALVPAGAVYLVLSRSFWRLATANRGTVRAAYREKAVRVGSVRGALLRKEWRRFCGSPVYMLNCGLGTLLMPLAAVLLLLKGRTLMDTLSGALAGWEEQLPLLAVAALCMLASMNDSTAPSVSLEGKHLWLVKVYPVPAAQVLMAKLQLQLLLTLPAALLLTAAVTVVLRPAPLYAVLLFAVVALYVVFLALWGLFLNLKLPNLQWINETVPVKQSLSVLLALFGGWAAVLVLGGLYAAVRAYLSPAAYLLGVVVLLAALSLGLYRWIGRTGARIFAAL